MGSSSGQLNDVPRLPKDPRALPPKAPPRPLALASGGSAAAEPSAPHASPAPASLEGRRSPSAPGGRISMALKKMSNFSCKASRSRFKALLGDALGGQLSLLGGSPS